MKGINRTHTGRMFGIVPVYLDMTNEDMPGIEGRYFWCDVALDICEEFFAMAVAV